MTAPTVRRRDAAASRARLLQAAVGLFAERGFDATTCRDIAERAGVDAALIARYFGGKTALYVAAVEAEAGDAPAPDLLSPGRTAALLERAERRGPGPVYRATVLPQDDPAVVEVLRAQLAQRVVGPLRDRLAASGADRPELRAELAVAAFVGVLLARSAGTLPALAGAAQADLVELLADLLGAVEP